MAKIVIDFNAPDARTATFVVQKQDQENDNLRTNLLAASLLDILAVRFLPIAIKDVMSKIDALSTVTEDALADEKPAPEVTDVRH